MKGKVKPAPKTTQKMLTAKKRRVADAYWQMVKKGMS